MNDDAVSCYFLLCLARVTHIIIHVWLTRLVEYNLFMPGMFQETLTNI